MLSISRDSAGIARHKHVALCCIPTSGMTSMTNVLSFSDTMSEVVLNELKDYVRQNLSDIIKKLEKFCKEILSKLASVCEKCSSLSGEVHIKREDYEKLKDSLKEAASAVNLYAGHVCDLYVNACNEKDVENTKRGIERGDDKLLEGFIEHLLALLKKADSSCEKAEKALAEVRSRAREMVTKCNIGADEAKSKMEGTKLVSGGGLALGGVLAAVGATVLIVSNPLAGVIGVVAGGVVGVGSRRMNHISSGFKKHESDLRELSQVFGDVKSRASSMFDFTRQIKQYLESLSDKLSIVNRAREAHDVYSRERLIAAFDRFCRQFYDVHSPTYRKKLSAIDDEFRERIEEIFKEIMQFSSDG